MKTYLSSIAARPPASRRSSAPRTRGPRLNPVALAWALWLALPLGMGNAAAQVLPSGASTVQGQASIVTQGNRMTVTTSSNAALNWQSFSIGAGQSVRFDQPNASSQVLNRVLGNDPSRIFGQLSSNGRVWLLNPNGVLFGPTARVDVAGLVASTLNLSNSDFLANRMNFGSDGVAGGAVVNQGRITAAPGGQVFLVGSAVDNQGVINAPNGDVVLAAGKSVRKADLLTTVETTEQALEASELFFQYYRENANYLERTYDFVERLGIEKVRKDTVYAPEPARHALLDRFRKSKARAKDAWLEGETPIHPTQFIPLQPVDKVLI